MMIHTHNNFEKNRRRDNHTMARVTSIIGVAALVACSALFAVSWGADPSAAAASASNETECTVAAERPTKPSGGGFLFPLQYGLNHAPTFISHLFDPFRSHERAPATSSQRPDAAGALMYAAEPAAFSPFFGPALPSLITALESQLARQQAHHLRSNLAETTTDYVLTVDAPGAFRWCSCGCDPASQDAAAAGSCNDYGAQG